MHRLPIIYLIFGLICCHCTHSNRDTPDPKADISLAAEPQGTLAAAGKTAAETYCRSCHLLPSPGLLDKKTWTEKVLPNMGARLGIRPAGYDPYENMEPEERAAVENLNVYPEKPVLSEAEWESIAAFYAAQAPEQLPVQQRTTAVSPSPPPFFAQLVEIGDQQFPQVTLLEYDPAGKRLFIGNHLNLYALDQQGLIVGNWQTQSPSVDISVREEGIFLLSIGEFNPSDKKEGVFFPLTLSSGKKAEDYVITGLPRPVHFTTGDLNGDRQDDVLISGFGNHQGQLAWYDRFQKDQIQVLSSLPGARKAVIEDLNGDGRQDVIALMAQAWEKIVIYYNSGSGNFREETAIALPAVYGASYFELADFNQDGHPDILLTNGDNWDYSIIGKPYHGLRIYLNDGKGQFTESFFYPMYGCSEARAVDFDRDGDPDIAAIAFYGEDAREGFVYLKNDGSSSFTAHYLPETACGKWLTMDTGDLNNDGFPDIFLGSYFHNSAELAKLMVQGVESFPEVLLLTFEK